jgi:hypothetical protein
MARVLGTPLVMLEGGLSMVGRIAAVIYVVAAATTGLAQTCEKQFDSTYELLQDAIFERRGCADELCHGAAVSGGLDLRAGASYDSLIDRPAGSVPGAVRVVPGQKDESLLFVNLAAATLPEQWQAPLRPMPLGALPALTVDELEAVREWIEHGAPRDGVVPGTDELLDACLPPPKPIEIAPLPPPAAGEGVQLHMPRWILPARSEDEVCFASYYDFTGLIPDEVLNEDGTMFRIHRSQIRQDPLSHHMISSVYEGAAAPDDAAWGTYGCKGGPNDGAACDPTELGACGEGFGCATDPESYLACIGYGPRDAGFGFAAFGITGVQETAAQFDFAPGVYFEFPVKGTIVWNSHAFNLTDEAGKLEAWVNLYFAEPAEQQHEVRRIFDVSQIFKPEVPAFSTAEVCHFYRFPKNAHLFELSSHMHKRGKRFRIWLGEFACQGGPHDGVACAPTGPDFDSPDLCAGAPCLSLRHILPGDCDEDDRVSVAEIVRGVRIALGELPIDSCPGADVDGDAAIGVNELVQSVQASLAGTTVAVERDAEEALMYTSLIYNDPLTLRMEPPMVFDSADRGERALTYCGLYDNGFTDPDEVKRRSTSPGAPGGIGGALTPECTRPTHCTEGRTGSPCSGGDDGARDASCDSSPGAGDGHCDACTLHGGVTTEDEMFVLFGAYYVP